MTADEAVVTKARAGDRQALGVLAEQVRPRVFGRCLRALGDVQAAEDVTQEVLVRLCQRLPSLRAEAAFDAWLGRLTARACADWWRTEQPAGVAGVDGEAAAGAADTDPLLDAPPACAEVLRLCCLEGLTLNQAAVRLGLPVTTAKSRLQIARRWLRKAWQPMHERDDLTRRRRRWLSSVLEREERHEYRAALEATGTGAPVSECHVPPSQVLLVGGADTLSWDGSRFDQLRDELRWRGLPARVTRNAGGLVTRLRRDGADIVLVDEAAAEDVWTTVRALRVDRATRGLKLLLLLNADQLAAQGALRAWQADVDCLLSKPYDMLEAAGFVVRLDAMLRTRDLEILATDHAWRGETGEALARLREAVALDREAKARAWANAAYRGMHRDEAFLAIAGPPPREADGGK